MERRGTFGKKGILLCKIILQFLPFHASELARTTDGGASCSLVIWLLPGDEEGPAAAAITGSDSTSSGFRARGFGTGTITKNNRCKLICSNGIARVASRVRSSPQSGADVYTPSLQRYWSLAFQNALQIRKPLPRMVEQALRGPKRRGPVWTTYLGREEKQTVLKQSALKVTTRHLVARVGAWGLIAGSILRFTQSSLPDSLAKPGLRDAK